MKPSLTLLTNTIPPKKRVLLKGARLLKRLILGKRPLIDRYEGHPSVTESVLKGLKTIGASFNYNPSCEEEVASAVLVLSHLEALCQAIDLKKRGRIQKLFAGPNLVIDPSDEREILNSSAIDGHIVPSDWVHDFYIAEIPALRGKCTTWPAGVDINDWVPDQSAKTKKNVLIYDKLDHNQPIRDYQKFLAGRGWDSSIIRYGSYEKELYKNMLRKSELALFFSPSESQGLALSECWSSNIPSLVWNQGWALLKNKRKRIPASSAPYLNSHLGYFFSDLTSFDEVFQKWEMNRDSFHPRQWVCSHLSNESCAKNLLKILGLAL